MAAHTLQGRQLVSLEPSCTQDAAWPINPNSGSFGNNVQVRQARETESDACDNSTWPWRARHSLRMGQTYTWEGALVQGKGPEQVFHLKLAVRSMHTAPPGRKFPL